MATAESNSTSLPALEAFLKESEIPNNDKLQELLEKLFHSNFMTSIKDDLSPVGFDVYTHVCAIIQLLKVLIAEKNSNQELQQMIHNTRMLVTDEKQNVSAARESVQKQLSGLDFGMTGDVLAMCRSLLSDQLFKDAISGLVGVFREIFEGFEVLAKPSAEPAEKESDKADDSKGGAKASTGKSFQANYETGLEMKRTAGRVKTMEGVVVRDRHDYVELASRWMAQIAEIARYELLQKTLTIGLSQIRNRIEPDLRSDSRSQTSTNWESNVNLRRASNHLKTLLENIANHHSLDLLFRSSKNLLEAISTDAQLRDLADALVTYIERAISDPAYRESEDAACRGANWIRDARAYLSGTHLTDIANLVQETSGFMNDLTKDPLGLELSEHCRCISNDMFVKNSKGDMIFQSILIRDLVVAVLPKLVDEFQTISIPKVVHDSKGLHFVIDAFEISTVTLIPKRLQMKLTHDWRVMLDKGPESHLVQQVYTEFNSVLPFVKNIPFSYKLQRGFAKLSDKGLLDIQVIVLPIMINPTFIICVF